MNNNAKICKEISKFLERKINRISEEELRFILEYYRNVRLAKYEINFEVTEKTILEDLKRLNEEISKGELTQLSFERLNIIMDLFDKLLSGYSLDDISYEIDKLFIFNDLDVRRNSNLIYKLKEDNKEK